MLIKWCKIQYLNLGKAFLFARNQLFVRKIENFDELQLPYSQYFLLKLCTLSTYECLQKGVWDFFSFCLELELLVNLDSVSV